MRCYITYCGDNGGSKEERLSKAPVWRVIYFHWLLILVQFSINRNKDDNIHKSEALKRREKATMLYFIINYFSFNHECKFMWNMFEQISEFK